MLSRDILNIIQCGESYEKSAYKETGRKKII